MVGAATCVAAGFVLGRYREYGALVGVGLVFTMPLCLLLVGVGLLLIALLSWMGVHQASSCLLYTVSFFGAKKCLLVRINPTSIHISGKNNQEKIKFRLAKKLA